MALRFPLTPASLVAFGGLPGSGKSTVAAAFTALATAHGHAVTVVSPDRIAGALYGSVPEAAARKAMPTVWYVAYAEAGAALARGETVLFDATLTRALDRNALIAIGGRIGTGCVLFAFAASQAARDRNAQRPPDTRVPDEWYDTAAREWEAGFPGLAAEGWDQVVRVGSDPPEPTFTPNPYGLVVRPS